MTFIIVLLLLLTACTTSERGRLTLHSSLERKESTKYFYEYEALIKSLLAQKSLNAADAYVLGEYFLLKSEFNKAENYLLSAMQSSDDSVVLASLALFEMMPFPQSSIESFSHIQPQSLNPKVLRYLLAQSALSACINGDIKQAASQLQRLHPMDNFLLFREPYFNGVSRFESQSVIETSYLEKRELDNKKSQKIVLPSHISEISLGDYRSFQNGDIYYLQSEIVVDAESESQFSLFLTTKSLFRLYLDRRLVLDSSSGEQPSDFSTELSISPGRHTVLIKVMPYSESADDIALFLVNAGAQKASVKWQLPVFSTETEALSARKYTQKKKENSEIFEHYLQLVAKSSRRTRYLEKEWLKFYSRVMGSDNPGLLWNLAESIFRSDSEKAQNLFENALSRYPQMDYIRLRYATLIYRDDDIDRDIIPLLQKEGEEQRLPELILAADYAMKKRWIPRYITLVQRMQKEFPDYLQLPLYRANIEWLQGNKREQILFEKIFFNRYPGNISFYSDYLERLQKSGDLDEILHFTTAVLTIYPHLQKYHIAQAEAFFALSRYQDAEKVYRAALELNPYSAFVLQRLGDVALLLKKRDEAQKWYLASRDIDPYDSNISNKLEQFDAPLSSVDLRSAFLSDSEVKQLIEESLDFTCNEDIDLLLDEGVLQFSETSSYYAFYRMIFRVMTKKGAQKLSHIPLSEEILSVKVTKADGTTSHQWHNTVSNLSFGPLSVGDVIEYTTRSYTMPLYWLSGLNMDWYFGQEGACLSKSRLTLRYPERLPLQIHQQGEVSVSNQKVVDGVKQISFEVNNMVFPQSDSYSFDDAVSRVVLSSVPSWKRVADQLFSFIRQNSSISKKVRDKAKKLYTDDDLARFIAKSYMFVVKSIHSLPREDDVVGMPTDADSVMRSGRGSYSDKANLMKSLLKAGGVDSFFVLTKEGQDGAVFVDMPAMQFTHTLLMIPHPTKDGAGLFFDFSLKGVAFGKLADGIEGKQGLFLNDEDGSFRFITIKTIKAIKTPPASEEEKK